jgi:hypothetical protein
MTAVEHSVAAWVAFGNVDAWLVLENIDALPPLPVGFQRVYCRNSPALRAIGRLPPKLLEFAVWRCPALRALPELPAQLLYLHCQECPALRAPLVLPASLQHLYCDKCDLWTAALPPLPPSLISFTCSLSMQLPDEMPPKLKAFSELCSLAIAYHYTSRSAVVWKERLRRQHATARARVAPALPPAAMLYV